MKIVELGYKSKYIEEAVVYENVAPSVNSEFIRHIRDATGHYISIYHLIRLINPFLGIRSVIFWSHRLLRWSVPFLLIFIFFLNISLLNIPFYIILFYLQILFYVFAFLGILFLKYKKIHIIFFIPYYFCNLNLALLLGFIKSILIKQKGTWESTER